jgi:uncharacterized nucleotidyltransferase DUF6036
MSFAEEVHHVALRIIELLERHSVPYAVMGGVAVPVWGIPRATYDVDVVLSVGEEGLREFLERAKDDGFQVDPPYQAGFRDVLKGMEKIRIEWWTAESRRVEVDVFLVTTAYQESAFSRRRRVRLDGREVWVLSAADLILHKLVAGRPKDLADIQNILAIQGLTEEEYLRSWAERLNVVERLKAAIRQAGE